MQSSTYCEYKYKYFEISHTLVLSFTFRKDNNRNTSFHAKIEKIVWDLISGEISGQRHWNALSYRGNSIFLISLLYNYQILQLYCLGHVVHCLLLATWLICLCAAGCVCAGCVSAPISATWLLQQWNANSDWNVSWNRWVTSHPESHSVTSRPTVITGDSRLNASVYHTIEWYSSFWGQSYPEQGS